MLGKIGNKFQKNKDQIHKNTNQNTNIVNKMSYEICKSVYEI